MSVPPILFNAEMVRAILDGRKTVTRRVVKFLENRNPQWSGYIPDGAVLYGSNNIPAAKSPYRPGDVLWVRETWRLMDFDFIDTDWSASVQYKADMAIGERWHDLSPDERTGWRPSIHMPKEAERIWLRVTDVRAERLQGITPEDVCNEGQWPYEWSEWMGKDVLFPDWREEFAELWDGTIKRADRNRYGWAANPWVWVIEFERCKKPEEG